MCSRVQYFFSRTHAVQSLLRNTSALRAHFYRRSQTNGEQGFPREHLVADFIFHVDVSRCVRVCDAPSSSLAIDVRSVTSN
jgi:hypothetical protein